MHNRTRILLPNSIICMFNNKQHQTATIKTTIISSYNRISLDPAQVQYWRLVLLDSGLLVLDQDLGTLMYNNK